MGVTPKNVSTLFPKILGQLDGFPKASKSLWYHLAKIFEIFKGPSIRTDIFPNFSFGFP